MDFVGNTRETVVVDDSESSESTQAAGAAESETAMQISKKSAKTIAKYGVEKCKIAWEQNRVHGEGPTVCSIESGIPVRSIDSAIEAYVEFWRAQTAAIREGLAAVMDFLAEGSTERKLIDALYVRACDLDSLKTIEQIDDEVLVLRGMYFALATIGLDSRILALAAKWIDDCANDARNGI